jgi:hypothetical protein
MQNQMLDSSYTTSALTSDEVDYLENVISNNYSSQEYNYYCEPDFKGQLMKYFPEPIISNFSNNNDHDLNLIKMSDLVQISDLNCINFHQKYFHILYNNENLEILFYLFVFSYFISLSLFLFSNLFAFKI